MLVSNILCWSGYRPGEFVENFFAGRLPVGFSLLRLMKFLFQMTKKREAVTKWSDIPLDSDRFVDEDARKEYERIKNMRPVYERGFLYDWELGTPLMASVSNLCGSHGWSDWAEHKYTHVNHHWVVEFYANKKLNAKTVWVRGKEVPVDAATIAEVLNLPVDAN